MTDSMTLIGMVAGFFTTVSFVPQVIRILKTRHTRDLSLLTYACFVLGIALWLVYGILLGAWPIIIYNIISFFLAGAVLVMKLRFG